MMDIILNGKGIRNPKIVEDLTIAEDNFLGKHKYFLVSESREKYIKLNKDQYEFYNYIIPFFFGGCSEEEIDTKLDAISNGKISAEEVINTFYKYNILEESHEKNTSKVELELSSRKILEIPLQKIQQRYKTLIHILDYVSSIIAVILIVIAIVLFIYNRTAIDNLVEISGDFRWAELRIKDFLIVIVFMFFSIPIHEMAHLLRAHRYGVGLKFCLQGYILILFRRVQHLLCYILPMIGKLG